MRTFFTLLFLMPLTVVAENAINVEMHQVSIEGIGDSMGHIQITQSAYGLVFTPKLTGLSAGIHGFHIHSIPSCDAAEKEGVLTAAESAGGHLNPNNTQHGHPWDDNAHLGDLPALYVLNDGTSTQPVLAPRLKTLEQVKNRSLMLHAGGDTHSDHPLALGGGGARIACGVIR